MSKRVIPAIRISTFSDAWEQRKLSEYLDVSNEKNTEEVFTKQDVLSVSGDFGIVNQIEFQGRSFAGASVSEYGVVYTGDVVYTKSPLNSNPYGIIKTNKGKPGIVSTLYAVYHPKDNVDSAFIQTYFEQHARMNNYMHPLVNKGAKNDMKVSSENALKGDVIFPDIVEQRQIVAVFANIDGLITLHQRKLEKVQQIRQMLLNQLFAGLGQKSPEIRFKGNKIEWHRMLLRDIVTPYTDYLPTPTDGYNRLGIRSHMKGTFYDYVAPSKKLGEKRLQRVKRDNLIVNIVFAWEHAVAITTEEDEGKLVSHRFPQFSFNEGMHPMFFRYALSDPRFRHHLFLASPSGAGRNKTLRIDEMMDYQLRVPEYEEQKKIAGCLETVDQLIELYEMELEKIRNVKSACLQGMFV